MARRVFFSFHYQNDIWRVSQIRNRWVTQDRQVVGFWDAAAWESVKRAGEQSIKNWINIQLRGTSVTVVLIGSETANRKYVKYEIQQSHELKKGILGIYIHNMSDQFRGTSIKGRNPFDNFWVDRRGQKVYLSQLYPTYDWIRDNGRLFFANWIEIAARKAGRL